MSASSSTSTGTDLWFTFLVPLPRSIDDEGEGIERSELDKRIFQRALILAGRDTKNSFLCDTHVLQKMVLVFKKDQVKVKVPVPVSKQLNLLDFKPVRGNRTLNLFPGRDDEFAQATAEKCIADVRTVEQDIQLIGEAIAQSEHVEAHQGIDPLPTHVNPAVLAFAVSGGTVDVDVDGHAIHIEASPNRSVWTAKQTTRLTLRMTSDPSFGRGFKGKVIKVHEGLVGAAKVGADLKLGFVKDRPLDRALLIIAAVLYVPVVLTIRQATSVVRKAQLTAEVLALENAAEILEAFLSKVRRAAEVKTIGGSSQ